MYIAEQLIQVNSRRINYLNFDTDNFIPNLLRIYLWECRMPKFSAQICKAPPYKNIFLLIWCVLLSLSV